jgi:hypothetical protein
MQATKKLPSKCKHQDRAKGLCRIMPWNLKIDFDLNVSTITTGCFQINLVCSVNDRGKVWEIKKVDERFIISHQYKKGMPCLGLPWQKVQ